MTTRTLGRRSWAMLLFLAACAPESQAADAAQPVEDGGIEDTTNVVDAPAAVSWRACDPLVPSFCGLPFPSDVYTRTDSSTATGRRVAFEPGALPDRIRRVAPFEALDGFSPGSSPMTYLPGATATGLPSALEIGRSLEADSPTVILDLGTRARVAHFAEIDRAYDDDSERAILLRPAQLLVPGHRYVVAIRGVLDGEGRAIAPSPTFVALRDELASSDPAVEERRDEYASLFATLSDAGVARESLQIAWAFTVGSRDAITGSLLHMRDETLASLGDEGARYTLTEVEATDDDPNLALRVRGTLHVPMYLTRAQPGGTLRRGPDGLPVAVGEMDVPFWMVIPKSAATTPGQLIQWGHGLLGTGEEIWEYGDLHRFLDLLGYVLFAIDWTGMASEDLGLLAAIASRGEIGDFVEVTDRLQQGILNALVAARTAHGGLASDPAITLDGVSPIDTSRPVVFVGQSQGGILGGTYMALTTDVERGVLIVPGQTYSFLLQRNRGGWDQFSPLFEANFGPIDIQRCLALMQLLWDRAEPTGYTPYIREDLLPGTPPHEVLMVVAINDHQVTTLAAHNMARSIGGVRNVGPVNRSIWGIEEASGTVGGSMMFEIDFGVPDVPLTNEVPPEGPDPHTMAAEPAWVLPTLHDFLQTGRVSHACEGPCDPT